MRHLGINIYFWKREAPQRLITELLAPVLETLQVADPKTRLWYTLFDARAPHLIAIISTSSQGFRHAQQCLTDRVTRYLGSAPIEMDLEAPEVERRHRQCRGRVISAIDAEPGLAEPNTFRIFEHGDDQFPFSLAGNASESWQLWSHSMDWVLRCLHSDNKAIDAARWIAAIDGALLRFGPELAESFWRRYACTLVLSLKQRLKDDESSVWATVCGMVGERNMKTFERIWALEDPAATDLAAALVRSLGIVEPADLAERWVPLREINHAVVAQLFQPVRLEIPMVLYAWLRSAKKELCHA